MITQILEKEAYAMTETYCSKSCADCTQKESLKCPGCKAGPGRAISGECDISQCCRSKYQQSCQTCTNNARCGKLRSAANMPDHIARKQRAAAAHQEMLAQKAPFLGKWLWLLFLLIIPGIIAGLMTDENIAQWLPDLVLPGYILTAATDLAYCCILWVLRSEDEHYRTAAKCRLITTILSATATLMSTNPDFEGLTIAVSLVNAVTALLGEYHEYTGHAYTVSLLDTHLSEQWDKLWVWYIATLAATIGSSILALLVSAMSLGLLSLLLLLVMFAASVGSIVVSVLKMVYLYRTAQQFRYYQP